MKSSLKNIFGRSREKKESRQEINNISGPSNVVHGIHGK